MKTKQDNTESTNALSREEGKLYSKIFNSQDIPSEFEDDAVDKVIQIAKIEGTSLDEAYKSSYFKT
ncbi:MAG: hypothetical protein U9R08_00985 [Nanoarchaeota archaeon]|nr:hypothetical protein [Nanoarchaeota archaeon]